MKKSQGGFTLIELVVVIVLLGILGVTALGKFQDLSLQAINSANSGIASEISSAASINYAASILGTTGSLTMNSGNDDCTTGSLQVLFASGVFPAGHLSATGAGTCAASGDTYTCLITDDDTTGTADTAATATILCTGG